jgi:fermentation-respiration switch protein FrsA (DUF1100 family)
MREDVSFRSHGTICRGWYYLPAKPRAPAIVMSHGFSAVKEQGLDRFAAAFNAAGFAVLLFDYRYLGASDGMPRQRIIPAEQHDDLRAALDWLIARDDIDSGRIGMWGTSYSGGHTLVLAAVDPRVKVAVAQVAAVDLAASVLHLVGRDGFAGLLSFFAADHAARNAGQPGPVIPVTAPPGGDGFLTTPDAAAWYFETARTAPNWTNEVTVESIARLIEYAPKNFIQLIAPKPLLIQAALRDAIIPIGQIRDAFAQAGEPKRLDEFDCGHFDFYQPGTQWNDRAIEGAVGWFGQYL